MKFPVTFLCTVFLALLSVTSTRAFAIWNGGSSTGGSSFVVSQRIATAAAVRSMSSSTGRGRRKTELFMGPKAKFGLFSPAVYAARVVLGSDKLNKIRGKAIALHSEKITEFCTFIGAYHLRTKLIKKAKTNGDTLGFLV